MAHEQRDEPTPHHEKPSYDEDCMRAGMCPGAHKDPEGGVVYCDATPGEHFSDVRGRRIHRALLPSGTAVAWTAADPGNVTGGAR